MSLTEFIGYTDHNDATIYTKEDLEAWGIPPQVVDDAIARGEIPWVTGATGRQGIPSNEYFSWIDDAKAANEEYDDEDERLRLGYLHHHPYVEWVRVNAPDVVELVELQILEMSTLGHIARATGNTVTDVQEILAEVKTFYENATGLGYRGKRWGGYVFPKHRRPIYDALCEFEALIGFNPTASERARLVPQDPDANKHIRIMNEVGLLRSEKGTLCIAKTSMRQQ